MTRVFRTRLPAVAPAVAMLIVAALLGGCASKFSADVTRFNELTPPASETVQVVAKVPGKQDTLEFQRYADMVGAALGRQGYRPPVKGQPSDLVAAIDFGVSQGPKTLRDNSGGSSVGVGVGGGGGNVGVGVSTAFQISGGDNTVYLRHLYVDLTRRSDGKRLFEGRAVSEGSTPDLGAVMPLLVKALFTDFPGKNGETRTIKLDAPRDGAKNEAK